MICDPLSPLLASTGIRTNPRYMDVIMHTSSVDLVQVYRSAAGTCRSTTADTGTTTHVVRV